MRGARLESIVTYTERAFFSGKWSTVGFMMTFRGHPDGIIFGKKTKTEVKAVFNDKQVIVKV